MEHVSFEGVNLAELLPRIPNSVKNDLPFGLVKLDLVGNILEYNMAEGDLTGVDPSWAIGRNFFDEVAICTKTPAFYGRFVEGVKKGFVNAVFDYTFDHREVATRVTVRMVSVPDHLGRKNVMILVKRADKPIIVDAYATLAPAPAAAPAPAYAAATPAPAYAAAAPAAPASPAISDIVAAVIAALNQSHAPAPVAPAATAPQPMAPPQAPTPAPVYAAAPAPVYAPAPAPAPAAPPPPAAGGSRHEDIIKF